MDLAYTEEERMMLEAVRDWVAGEVRPRARELDEKGEVPRDLVGQMQEMGLFGLMIPEEYGGSAVSGPLLCGVIEELSRACAAIAVIVMVHNSVGAFPILRFGREEQRRRYLPKLATDWIGAFSLTEPEAGSDAASLRCRAERLRADGSACPEGEPPARYRLNGSKVFVTNGSIANLYLVMARTAESAAAPHRGITAFLIEQGTPGLEVGKHEDKMGLRASDTVELVFRDCEIEAPARLGEEGEGFRVAMTSLDSGRISVGAQAVGIAQGALDEAIRYAGERRQFGQPLSAFQAIQFLLADMQTKVDAARLLVLRAAGLKDAGGPVTKEAAMAKLYASRMAEEVCSAALQIHGGYGYCKEYAVERLYRDARITQIYEGTNEIQRTVIARQLLDRPA